jgi:hypothetical protein
LRFFIVTAQNEPLWNGVVHDFVYGLGEKWLCYFFDIVGFLSVTDLIGAGPDRKVSIKE